MSVTFYSMEDSFSFFANKLMICLFFSCVSFSAAIKEKYSDWTEFLVRDLTGSRTAPANLLEGVSAAASRLSTGFYRAKVYGLLLQCILGKQEMCLKK